MWTEHLQFTTISMLKIIPMMVRVNGGNFQGYMIIDRINVLIAETQEHAWSLN